MTASTASRMESQALRENAQLRVLLWATHPCDGKYGDDGELQCGACRLDFRRQSVAEITEGIQRRSLEFIDWAQWHVCARCGVTRFTHEAVTSPCTHEWVRSAPELFDEDARALEAAAKALRPYARGLGWFSRRLLLFVVGFLNGRAGTSRALARLVPGPAPAGQVRGEGDQ